MRLVTFDYGERRNFGCLAGNRVLDLASPPAAAELAARLDQVGYRGAPIGSLQDLLDAGSEALGSVREMAEHAASHGDSAGLLDVADVRLTAPLPKPGKIIAVGRNYRDHASEAAIELPDRPRLFPKWSSTVIGPGAAIIRPQATRQLDYEVELAAIIGRPASCVPLESALDYVAGYTIINDVSARDIQFGKPEQLALGKNYRTFTPMGSWIVTSDEVPDPGGLDIRAWVNDELVQDSNTRNLIFDVPHLVSFLSSVLDLDPGDVISTGTPAGVGIFRDPPILLAAGDQVRMQLGEICELSNYVIDEPAENGS